MHPYFSFRKPSRCRLEVLCILLLAFPVQAGHRLNPDQAKLLSAWLSDHPGFRTATDADCDCAEDISQVQAGYGGIWKAMPDYHPYVATGDFNSDGETDFAVVLINQASLVVGMLL
jgi:hypothetical protein